MGKILVLGNESSGVLEKIPNLEFLSLPTLTLGEDGERKLNEFLIKNVPQGIEKIIIDVDNSMGEDYCLSVTMSLRLSLFEIRRVALAPIILLTRRSPDIFKENKYSSITLTVGVYIATPENIEAILGIVQPLNVSEYKTKFLDLVKILPNAKEGWHSIANQWGADVLGRIVLGRNTPSENIKKARLSMCFKYVQVLTLKESDIEHIVNGKDIDIVSTIPLKINATGKKILLIDDEADKGWDAVLAKLLFGSKFDVICERVPNYDSLSNDAREKIETGDYDLIFLDLRMNGVNEENIANPADFSGMKILNKIKEINKGTQVIMFTASNKAWNLKALLDAGANGYYIKESPEYAFEFSHSEKNAEELFKNIRKCFANGFLREIYKEFQELKELISMAPNVNDDWKNEAKMYIEIAFDLLLQSNGSDIYKAYSYLQLFFIIEKYVEHPFVIDEVGKDYILYGNEERRYKIAEFLAKRKFKTCISFREGHYILGEGEVVRLDANFRVSALLIFKFDATTSSVNNWTKIYEKRNTIAHPEGNNVSNEELEMIIKFIKYFLDENNAKWGNAQYALSEETDEERLTKKFNNR